MHTILKEFFLNSLRISDTVEYTVCTVFETFFIEKSVRQLNLSSEKRLDRIWQTTER